ncbi:MAG: YhcH/YjgK/YiaL family protein [Acholeplasmatales bacterium]|jgi:YhcH/YjgK/YiaL family protein|nr:YhcH/YjgK/YiaL family protein [Acholeplasmatales bacterium]
MIFAPQDSFKNGLAILEELGKLNPNFLIAYHYLQNNDLHKLPLGRTIIEGINVYVNKEVYQSKEITQCQGETHYQYADIQIVLSGEEFIGYLDIEEKSKYQQVEPYNEDKDVTKYVLGRCSLLLHNSTNFSVFFPNDVHMPKIRTNTEGCEVTKIVFKVRL